MGCHDGNSGSAVDDMIARSDEDDAPAELVGMEEAQRLSDRTIRKFKRPGTLQWNNRDGHHFPNQIRITGVMRVYARQSHQRDAKRLLDLIVGKVREGTGPRDGGSSCQTIAPAQAKISSSRSAAENAERLLCKMWNEHDCCRTNDGRRRSALLPDVVMYSAVISPYATCLDQSHGIGCAWELLPELEGLAARELDEACFGPE